LNTLLGEICGVRALQKSAEAVVVKKAGESRKERRAKEPRDRPAERTLEAEREVSRNSLGASEERTTQTGCEGRVKQWICLKEPSDGKQARTRRNKVQKG